MIPSGNLIGFQATLHFPDCIKVTCGHICWLKWYTTWGLQVKFSLGKMRTAAWKTAPQIALRNCFKEVVGEDQYIRSQWKGSSVQPSAYFTKGFLLVTRHWCHHEGSYCFSRYEEVQGLGTWNQFLIISVWRPVYQFPWSTECLTFHAELLSGGAEGQQLQHHKVPFLQRQMANALVVAVQSLANALGKSQFVVDTPYKETMYFMFSVIAVDW